MVASLEIGHCYSLSLALAAMESFASVAFSRPCARMTTCPIAFHPSLRHFFPPLTEEERRRARREDPFSVSESTLLLRVKPSSSLLLRY